MCNNVCWKQEYAWVDFERSLKKYQGILESKYKSWVNCSSCIIRWYYENERWTCKILWWKRYVKKLLIQIYNFLKNIKNNRKRKLYKEKYIGKDKSKDKYVNNILDNDGNLDINTVSSRRKFINDEIKLYASAGKNVRYK